MKNNKSTHLLILGFLILSIVLFSNGCKKDIYQPVLNHSLVQYSGSDKNINELVSSLTKVEDLKLISQLNGFQKVNWNSLIFKYVLENGKSKGYRMFRLDSSSNWLSVSKQSGVYQFSVYKEANKNVKLKELLGVKVHNNKSIKSSGQKKGSEAKVTEFNDGNCTINISWYLTYSPTTYCGYDESIALSQITSEINNILDGLIQYESEFNQYVVNEGQMRYAIESACNHYCIVPTEITIDVNGSCQNIVISHSGVPENDPNGDGSGGTGGSGPLVTTDIKENITDSCLQATYNAIANTGNINNKINNLIQGIFNKNDKVNLTYNQSTNLSSTTMGNTVAGYDGVDASGAKIYNVNVDLNVNVLPGYSQELTAVTILHEALHGYFNYNGLFTNQPLAQHLVMATKYVDLLRTSVQSAYPNLQDKDANILILSEMADIYAQSPTTFTTLLSQYNITATDYNNTIPTFKSGSAGTRCKKP